MSAHSFTPHPTIAGAGIAGTMSGWSVGHIIGATGTLHDVLPVLVGGTFSILAAVMGRMRRRDVLDIKADLHDLQTRMGHVEGAVLQSKSEA